MKSSVLGHSLGFLVFPSLSSVTSFCANLPVSLRPCAMAAPTLSVGYYGASVISFAGVLFAACQFWREGLTHFSVCLGEIFACSISSSPLFSTFSNFFVK